MKQYHQLLQHILDHGEIRQDRTGTGTQSVFGYQMRFDLTQGFPAVTTKKLAWRSVVSELLWFLEGSTDERRLAEIQHGTRDPSKTTIWTANANAQGVALGYRNDDQVKELGPIYSKQWRDFNGVDQISDLIHGLRHEPFSRRHILNSWNVGDLHKMALPPCHVMAQFYVSNHGELSCQLYQRSVDAPLGLPFNIASYSLLTHMLAQIVGLTVKDFVWTGGDCHVYLNQIEGISEQLRREPYPLPKLLMPDFKNLQELLATTPDNYKLVGYQSHPTIRMEMSV